MQCPVQLYRGQATTPFTKCTHVTADLQQSPRKTLAPGFWAILSLLAKLEKTSPSAGKKKQTNKRALSEAAHLLQLLKVCGHYIEHIHLNLVAHPLPTPEEQSSSHHKWRQYQDQKLQFLNMVWFLELSCVGPEAGTLMILVSPSQLKYSMTGKIVRYSLAI